MLSSGGDSSYSTYLFHPFILMGLVVIWGQLPLVAQEPVVFIIISLIFTNFFGYLIYSFVEKPITFKLREILGEKVVLAKLKKIEA